MSAQRTHEDAARQALASIKAADERLRAAKAAAEATHTQEVRGSWRELNALLDLYRNKAYEIACEADAAPVNRSGSPMHASSYEVVDEGIEVRWYMNDEPDWYFTATWAQLRGEAPAVSDEG